MPKCNIVNFTNIKHFKMSLLSCDLSIQSGPKKVIPTLSNFGDAMKDTSSLPVKSDEMK